MMPLTTICLYAQEKMASYIFDLDSNMPIPYANIGIASSNNGTVSDINGYFELQSNSKTDSITFSALGYATKTVCLNDIKANTPISLKPISYIIDEIQISGSNLDKEMILGERNENGRGHSFGFGSAQLGTELGALIEIRKETFIKSVNFVLNHAKGDSLLLRINIYDYQDGEIGEKVLKENIYWLGQQRSGTFTIDLLEYEIILNSDVLLSLEWLRNFDETGNKSITFDTKKSNILGGTFIKYSSNTPFKQLPYKKKYKPCIYFVGKQSSG